MNWRRWWARLRRRRQKGAEVAIVLDDPPATAEEAEEHLRAAVEEAERFNARTAFVSSDVLRDYIERKDKP